MSEELVVVANYSKLMEAESAKLRFEAEGFTPFLADAETVNMDWLLGNAIGNVKLQVPSSQADGASALLLTMREERLRHAGETDEHCLSCGAVLPESAAACPACGWSFAESALA